MYVEDIGIGPNHNRPAISPSSFLRQTRQVLRPIAFLSRGKQFESENSHPPIARLFPVQSLLAELFGRFDLGGNLPFGVDLKLAALTDNGGPTKTHALQFGSPAINKGSNPASLTSDQRGKVRDHAGGVDVGAFELITPPTVTNFQVNDGNVQRSMVTSFKVSFSEAVTFPDGIAAAFEVQRTGPGTPTSPSVVLAFNQVGNDVTITFNDPVFAPASGGNSLIDGNYQLTLNANKILGTGGFLDGNGDFVAGDNQQFNTFRLFGDGNGDRTVNSTDFAMFRSVFGVAGPVFDSDGNGVVNSNDFAEFRKRFGLTLVP